MSDFKWGVIGPGRIAEKFAEAFSGVEGGVVHAVASTNLSKAESYKAKFGAEVAYGSHEALLTDTDVDAVYIAVPHRYHLPRINTALNHGKPVLCEKPLTVTALEAQSAILAARSSDIFLMEAFWSRFLPIYDQVRTWLDAGRIGDIQTIHTDHCFKAPSDPTDRWFSPELAGGALLDLGVYNINLTNFVLGERPIDVSASGVMAETGVDMSVGASLKYGSGVIATMYTSFRSNSETLMTITGSHGKIEVGPRFVEATKATLTVGDQVEVAEADFASNGFEYEIMEAQRCIQNGLKESATMPLSETIHVMSVMDDIREQIGLHYPFEG